jgi:hypothetical protein
MTARFATCGLLALLAAAGSACDPSAESAGGVVAQAGGSAELESCAATSQCAAGLRCIERVCTPEAASVLGDYYAATGRLALERRDTSGAIERFSRAVNQYESDGVTPPAALYCEQGHALVADRMNPERAEVGARVLHRCLLRAPPGSELRRRALADLALLDELGLEPLTLNRSEPADAYLTRAPSRPPVENLKVTLAGEGTRARTFTRFVSHLESQDLADTLSSCWKDYWQATFNDELVVSIPFRYNFRLTRHEDFDRAVIVVPDDASAPSGEGMPEAYRCAVDALAPIADEFSRTQYDEVRWNATIAFTIAAD